MVPGVGRGHNRENHIRLCLYWGKNLLQKQQANCNQTLYKHILHDELMGIQVNSNVCLFVVYSHLSNFSAILRLILLRWEKAILNSYTEKNSICNQAEI
jgi:hypothetical protein